MASSVFAFGLLTPTPRSCDGSPRSFDAWTPCAVGGAAGAARRPVNWPTPPRVSLKSGQPTSRYLAIPTLSSERRPYIPMALLPPTTIASNQIYVLPSAMLWHLGVLHSAMHMAWIRQVCGRLETRYRYSNAIVYNNYPWPQDVTDAQRERVESAAQGVLDARGQFADSTLADLYDPNAMPPLLRRAHEALDRAVDRCYRAQPFTTERQRLEFLFALYERLIAPLAPARRAPRRRG